METFSQRLSALLEERKMSQKQLSELAHVTQGAISKYLNGQEPKSAELFRIARALEVSMDYLYSGRNRPKPLNPSARTKAAEEKLKKVKNQLKDVLREI